MAISLTVNGTTRSVEAEPDTPLLYVLRNDFELNGAKFGCGRTQCGACAVLINGAAVRSCVMPIANLSPNEITTLEGLSILDKLHPLQKAFIDEQAAQCGYCASRMIISAADLLNRNPQPTEAEVRSALAGNLCRCGSHNRIIRAVIRGGAGERKDLTIEACAARQNRTLGKISLDPHREIGVDGKLKLTRCARAGDRAGLFCVRFYVPLSASGTGARSP